MNLNHNQPSEQPRAKNLDSPLEELKKTDDQTPENLDQIIDEMVKQNGAADSSDAVTTEASATKTANNLLEISQQDSENTMGTHQRNLSSEEPTLSQLCDQEELKPKRIASDVSIPVQTPEQRLLQPSPTSGEDFDSKRMMKTLQRPASASFATQQRAQRRRVGSFVSSGRSIDNATYQDRVPVRLVFKNEKLQALAKQHLKSDVVMVLETITVNELIEKMLQAMQAPRQIRLRHIQMDFYGKSQKFPIRFEGGDLMEKVFKRICQIEESRELSRNSSNEDLHNKQLMTVAT